MDREAARSCESSVLPVRARWSGLFRPYTGIARATSRDSVYLSIIDDELPAVKQRLGAMMHVVPVEPARTAPFLLDGRSVESARQPTTSNIAALRQLARLLDAAVRVPGTNIRFGLDAVLGLIPGAGDIAGGVLSSFIILQAAKLGAPRSVLARMVMNVAIDSIVGAVPVLGDLFDIGWKSNTRNADLLEQFAARPTATQAASRWAVVGAIGAVALIVIVMIALVVAIIRGLAGLAS
jgi:hypothetical protein